MKMDHSRWTGTHKTQNGPGGTSCHRRKCRLSWSKRSKTTSMNSNDPRSIDFAYKKYSLEQLDNWVNDALNCEDLTPEDIYDTIVNVVDESVEYHKKHLTKSIELLSLLKGHRSFEIDTSLDDVNPSSGVSPTTTEVTKKDWIDFWSAESSQYTEEEMNAMCDAVADKEKCREYNLREAEYYDKRARLDLTYDDMIAKGYTMTDDGFWIKE